MRRVIFMSTEKRLVSHDLIELDCLFKLEWFISFSTFRRHDMLLMRFRGEVLLAAFFRRMFDTETYTKHT